MRSLQRTRSSPTKALIGIALAVALSSSAWAQSSVVQGGAWSAGHVPQYVGQGTTQPIVQDGGTAAGGATGVNPSAFGITARGTGTPPYVGQGAGSLGSNFCMFDAPTSNATGYHYLCLDPNMTGGFGGVVFGAGGTASTIPFNFVVNGTSYTFPFTTTGVVGPSTSIVGDVACWNNLVGTLLKDCGAQVNASSNNVWTGTNNFTSTFSINSVAQTFPASGSLLGASDVQTITNKHINAAQLDSGVIPNTAMPALTGDVTNSSGTVATTLGNSVVTNAKLAQAAANTVKANGTGLTANLTDFAMPSCSGAGNAIQWLSGTGFQCGTLTNQTAGWGLTGSSTFSVSTSAPPFGMGMPINMGFTASVGSSALTINLRTAAGNAPSATDPVLIPFRSTTLTTGTVAWGAITSALSIVVPSSATLGTSNNVPFRVWIFAAYNAGVPELGVAVCSVQAATPTIYPCASWEATRKTTISIDGFATSAGVLYATTGVSNDAVRIIGYADFASGLATAGAWVSVPTTLQVVSPQTPRPGVVIQTIPNTTTTVGSTTSATFVALTSGQTQAIIPTSAINLIRASAFGTMGTSTGGAAFVQLVRGSTLIGNPVGSSVGGGVGLSIPAAMFALDAPQSTSSATYGFQGKTAAGTLSYPITSSGSYLLLEEIMGALPEPANDSDNPGVFALTG